MTAGCCKAPNPTAKREAIGFGFMPLISCSVCCCPRSSSPTTLGFPCGAFLRVRIVCAVKKSLSSNHETWPYVEIWCWFPASSSHIHLDLLQGSFNGITNPSENIAITHLTFDTFLSGRLSLSTRKNANTCR